MFKRIKRFLIYIFSFLLILLFIITGISIVFRDKFTSLFLVEINKNLKAEIHVKSIDFTLIKKFPYATVVFDQIYSNASKEYLSNDQYSSFDTLFSFKTLYVEFNIYDLIKKNYKVSKIQALNGSINLAKDKLGNYNYLIWKNSAKTDTNENTVKLQSVNLTNIKVTYSDFKDVIELATYFKKCQIKCSFSPYVYELSSKFSGRILNFQYNKLQIPQNKNVVGSVNLKIFNGKVQFDNSSITLAENKIIFDGIYNSNANYESKFILKSDNIKIENAILLFPENLIAPYLDLKIKGILSLNTTITSSKSKNHLPLIETRFSPLKSSLSLVYKNVKLTDLNFNGYFHYQGTDSFKINEFRIDNIKGKMDTYPFEGAFKFFKSKTSSFDLQWKGYSCFNTLHQLIPNDTLDKISGNFNGQLEIRGYLKSINNITKYDFAHFLYKGEINLDNLKIIRPEYFLGISDISGKFIIDKDIDVLESNIIFKENHLIGSGKIENFLPWLLTANESLGIQGNVQAQLFNLDKVIIKRSSTNTDSSETHFPDHLFLELNVKFKEFIAGKFKALNVAGKITYKPKFFDLRSLYFETMEGNLSGSAILIQKPDNHFILRTQTLLEKVNISTLFSTFNNFGQPLIEYKNIKGKISGLTNFSAECSNYFSIITPTILVDGNVKIENGELIEYEPLNGLSRYLNVEELKHIYFSTIQNDIFIRNSVINIPQINISASNFDIIGSGTHNFNNNFNYKIKVKLSETLYKKAKKSKNQMDEFGIFETNNSRKISLPLTIMGNIDNYKISYDPKQAAANMMQNLKNEKMQLRTLLNEEFGIFKKDSLSIVKKEKKKEDNILIEFENENYQAGKRADSSVKVKSMKQKKVKDSKDSTKIKIDFE
jgi:AsmA-like C-terminal region